MHGFSEGSPKLSIHTVTVTRVAAPAPARALLSCKYRRADAASPWAPDPKHATAVFRPHKRVLELGMARLSPTRTDRDSCEAAG